MNKPFERITVVGSGILGTQIAMFAAHAGYAVKIYDTRHEAFEETYAKLHDDLKAKGINPVIPWDRWQECKDAVWCTTDLKEALRDVDFVVEAVTEDLEVKREIFKKMGEMAPAKAIFATNSSSIPVSRLEESSSRPRQCLNTHFYMPLQGIMMADLMGGTQTLPEIMEKGEQWLRSMGFVPLRVKKEILGFCFNSIWRAIKKQSLHMWANDFVDFQDIDRAFRIFTGAQWGPFGLMDTVGLDTVANIEMVYFDKSKDPRDKPPQRLLEKIEQGELGVKAGKGFYTYPDPEYLDADFLNPEKKG
ncbi:MAG: 3-hydroxyacyl-CoA dehydrogenase family protein [Syntrophobacteraceae bacterium]